MQADLLSIIETVKGSLVGTELLHSSVDLVFVGSDPNEVTDDLSNVLLATNLVHTRLMAVAEEVDIVAILFTNNHTPPPKVVERARELEIDLITTQLTLEEVHRLVKGEFGTSLEIRARLQPH